MPHAQVMSTSIIYTLDTCHQHILETFATCEARTLCTENDSSLTHAGRIRYDTCEVCSIKDAVSNPNMCRILTRSQAFHASAPHKPMIRHYHRQIGSAESDINSIDTLQCDTALMACSPLSPQ